MTAVLNAADGWQKRDAQDDGKESNLARPAFLSMLLLAGLSLLLSVPGLRPPDLSARSQATRLRDPALSETETTAAVLYLRDRGGAAGKATLRGLGKQTLPAAAQVRVKGALALSAGEFSDRYSDRQDTQSGWLKNASFSLIPGSRPLTDTQKRLVREGLLRREDNGGSVGPSVCHGLPARCTLKLYAVPVTGNGDQAGTLQVLVVGPNSAYDGP